MLMKNNDLISVIVPIYKVENEVKRCVDSIINQTYKNIEIILVDDGSPDNCPSICDNYALRDNRIVAIHKENGGLSDARNVGLKKAKGKYVLYVDSDDYIEIDACEKLIEFAEDDIDVVVGACKEIQGKTISYQKHTNLKVGERYTSKEYIIKSIQNNEWYAPAWLNLYRRDFLVQNNLYYRKGYLFEDIDMLPRLFLSAKVVTYSDCCFYNYVIRDNSIMTSEITNSKQRMLIAIYQDWINLILGLEDLMLAKYMSGILIKYYLKSASRYNIRGWKVGNFDLKFALKYSLNNKEKMKVVVFNFAPRLYSMMSKG